MSLRSELETLAGAIRFFTRLPLPGTLGQSDIALEKAIRYFPLTGIVIGFIAALVFVVCAFFWPESLAVLAAMAGAMLLTGALHEDGWSDMVDGFGGGWDKERILAIMRDSRLGSFGAVALVVLLLTRFFCLLEIEPALIPAALIAGHAFSRLCSFSVLATMDYARNEGKAKAFSNRPGTGSVVFAVLSALLPLLLLPWPQVLFAVVLASFATLWLRRLFERGIGGYTGDCLGATQQLAEVAFYAGLLCEFT